MSVHRVLTWLCERPQGDFTLGWALRKGWPEFASIVLLPKQLELGRAAPGEVGGGGGGGGGLVVCVVCSNLAAPRAWSSA